MRQRDPVRAWRSKIAGPAGRSEQRAHIPDRTVPFDHAFPGIPFPLAPSDAAPETDWRDEYLRPLGARAAAMKEERELDADRRAMLGSIDVEVEIYEPYSRWYGYEFLVLEKAD